MVVGFRTGHLNAPWSLFCKHVDLTQEGGILTITFWDYHAGNTNFRVNAFRPWHIPLKHLTGTQWRPNGDKVRIIQSVEEQDLRKHLTLYSRLIPNSLGSPGWPHYCQSCLSLSSGGGVNHHAYLCAFLSDETWLEDILKEIWHYLYLGLATQQYLHMIDSI